MWKQIVFTLLACSLAYWFMWEDKLETVRDKRVVVTGASDGIGEQLAYHYARLGANVVVTARRLEKLNKVVKKCQSLSPSPSLKHYAVSADMSNMEETKRVIQESVRLLGGLDILVLNHITGNNIQAFNGKQEDLKILHKVMDINFRAYVHLASHAMPELLANNGSLIVVNSVAGRIPQVYLPAYSSSKFALNGFFNSLRNQFEAHGQNVSVTSCTLGFIGTDSALDHLQRAKENPALSALNPASPSDTALDIIIGGARREIEVYTPWVVTRSITWLYALIPRSVEFLVRYVSVALGTKKEEV